MTIFPSKLPKRGEPGWVFPGYCNAPGPWGPRCDHDKGHTDDHGHGGYSWKNEGTSVVILPKKGWTRMWRPGNYQFDITLRRLFWNRQIGIWVEFRLDPPKGWIAWFELNLWIIQFKLHGMK